MVDPDAGVIVVSDRVQEWTNEMKAGKSRNHVSGALHWLTLNNSYDITHHEVIQMRCVQSGYMNVNPDGHLLVLTHCTTGQTAAHV